MKVNNNWLKEQKTHESELLGKCQELVEQVVSNLMPKIREKALENNFKSDLNISLEFDLKKAPKLSGSGFVPPIIEKCRKF
jgi:hypothetical protein